MIRSILAMTAGFALAAAPLAAQNHQHHMAGTDSTAMMTSGMMTACPFLQGVDSVSYPMGMMGPGAMGSWMQGQGMMGQGMMGMHQQGMAMMDHGLMGMATWGPGSLLAVSDELGLTQNQVDELTTLREQAMEEAGSHMGLAREVRARAMGLLEQDPVPFDKYESEVKAAADQVAEAQVAVARAGVEALNLLTTEQREKLSSMLPGMGHGGSGHGMMTRDGGHHGGSAMRHPGGLR